ncbi:MAG TPA: succinyl-diaminopimelate desuccinylase [Rhizomicrobium sp.]|jgi:succinyl-diaminopimelate desuccinylase|nr:succinyl-diaminopimelate desuccinylase [Rhizomicrobium sp.]
MSMLDPVALTQALIRCPSVTPVDGGVLAVLEAALKPLGFACHRLRFEEAGTAPVENLYARIGAQGPNFCFAGHTDVVPPGDAKLWTHDPFAGAIEGGTLYGRGASDMKSAVACFAAAAARFLADGKPYGSISLLITGDEEGPTNVNGTRKMLAWLQEHGERLDHCIVGEPTATARAGDTIKIGRRGTMNARLTVTGVQGHAAYPKQGLNPIPALAELVTRLADWRLDDGTAHFDPSNLSFTTIDVGNPATNVTPAEARAAFNIRFNDLHRSADLIAHIEAEARVIEQARGVRIALTAHASGEPFLTRPGAFTDLLARAAQKIAGTMPVLSTTGGTSDARFIKEHCPVAELGLSNATMHKANECATLEDIRLLTDIYAEILAAYFAAPPG